jgi:hypothetical protein
MHMSQQCPRCGLFNPPAAARCDCGYDFASKSVKASYLLAHAIEKHGGEAKIIEQASRSQIRTGIVLLVVSAVVTGGSLLAGGNVYFWGGATMFGALLLYRGVRQRGQRTLDRATRDELTRRS